MKKLLVGFLFLTSCATVQQPRCSEVISDFYKNSGKNEIVFGVTESKFGYVFKNLDIDNGSVKMLCLFTPEAHKMGASCMKPGDTTDRCTMSVDGEIGGFYKLESLTYDEVKEIMKKTY